MPPFDWWEIKEAIGMANDPLGAGHAAPELLEGLWTRREGALSASPVLVATTDSFFPLKTNQSYGTRRDGDTHSVKRFAPGESSHSYSFASDHIDIRNAMTDPVALPVGSLSLGYNPGVSQSGIATLYGPGSEAPVTGSPLVYRPALQSVNGNYFNPTEVFVDAPGVGVAVSIIVCGLTRIGWMPITCFSSNNSVLTLRRRSTLAIGDSLAGNNSRDDLAYLIWTHDGLPVNNDLRSNFDYRGFVTSDSAAGSIYPIQLNNYGTDAAFLANFGKVPVFGVAGSPVLHESRLFFTAGAYDPSYFRFDNYYAMFDGTSVYRVKRSYSGAIIIFVGGFGGGSQRFNYTASPSNPLAIYWTDPGVGWSEAQQNYAVLSTNKSQAIRQLFSTSYGVLILTDEEAFALRGDFAANISQENLPVQVGCDTASSFGACQVNDDVFTVWRGRLWLVTGGRVEPVSDGLFIPGDSSQQVVGVSYDSVNQVLLVATNGSGGNSNWYCYDLLRRHWFRPKAGTSTLGQMGLLRDSSGSLMNFTSGINGEALRLRATRTARVRYVTDMGDPVNRKVVRHIRFKVRDSNIGAGVTWQIRWSLDNGAYTAWSALSNKGDGNLYYNFRPQTCREFAFELRAVAAGANNPVISDDKITELMIEMPIRIGFTRPGGVR